MSTQKITKRKYPDIESKNINSSFKKRAQTKIKIPYTKKQIKSKKMGDYHNLFITKTFNSNEAIKEYLKKQGNESKQKEILKEVRKIKKFPKNFRIFQLKNTSSNSNSI
ncbi:hypothetical protein ACFL2K_00135 [Candidatus Margulisiibacteriota bacterium]